MTNLKTCAALVILLLSNLFFFSNSYLLTLELVPQHRRTTTNNPAFPFYKVGDFNTARLHSYESKLVGTTNLPIGSSTLEQTVVESEKFSGFIDNETDGREYDISPINSEHYSLATSSSISKNFNEQQ